MYSIKRLSFRLCPFVLLLFVPALNAQTLTGRVTDFQHAPLPGANVAIKALQQGTITDVDGQFILEDLPAARHEVTISFVGFEAVTRTVDLSSGDQVLYAELLPDTSNLEEVLIETDALENRLTLSSQSLTVLSVKDLDLLRGRTLGEMLENVAGVTALNTGPTISKPVIRGLHSDRIVILNAGLAQEGQQWGGEHAPEIDPFSPNQIQVLRGAAGVEHGVGAIGGVIRIEPRSLRATPGFGGQVTTNTYTNSRQGAGALLLEGGSARWQGMGWRLQGSFRKAGNSDTPNYGISNSGFQEVTGSVALGYRTENKGIETLFSHFGTELGIFTGAHIGNVSDLERAIEQGHPSTNPDFTYTIDNPKQRVLHDRFSVKSFYSLAPEYHLEGQYGFQQNLRKEFDAHRPFGSEVPTDRPAFELQLQTHSLDLKLRHGPHGNHYGVIGWSGMRQTNINGATGFLIPNFKAYTGGLYARETILLGRWTIDTGARFDIRRMTAFPLIDRQFETRQHNYSNLSAVVGLLYQLTDHWSLGMHVGSAWRPPGVNELYSDGVHHGTAQYERGDPSLEAERNQSLDATLRHQSPHADVEIGAYYNRFKGYISLFPAPQPTLTIRGAFPTFTYAQSDATLSGLDGVASYQVMKHLRLGAAFSLVRGTNRNTDAPLFLMPADQMRLSVQVDLPNGTIRRDGFIKPEVRWVAQQDRVPKGVDYADPPEGYVLFNLSAGTTWLVGGTPVQFNASVQNLMNTAYRDYLSRFRYFTDDPGRSVIFRLQIPFGAF